jgi:hypothetical protein
VRDPGRPSLERREPRHSGAQTRATAERRHMDLGPRRTTAPASCSASPASIRAKRDSRRWYPFSHAQAYPVREKIADPLGKPKPRQPYLQGGGSPEARSGEP